MLPNVCMYPSHPEGREYTRMSLYHYEDPDNGIVNGIHICRECYAEHLLRFYPDSMVAQHIRDHPTEWKNTWGG